MRPVPFVEQDSRELLFKKIIESLRLTPNLQKWDLSWGGPFLAVTHDRNTWVRVFYEESAPAAIDRLQREMTRLQPFVPAEGDLCFCVPKSWGFTAGDLPEAVQGRIQLWNYEQTAGGVIMERSEKGYLQSSAAVPANSNQASHPQIQDMRLTREEVRELTEMGLELKRLGLPRAS